MRNSSLYSDQDILDALGHKNILLSKRNDFKKRLAVNMKLVEKEKKELHDNFRKEKTDYAKQCIDDFAKWFHF